MTQVRHIAAAAIVILTGSTIVCAQVIVMPRVDTANAVVRHIVQTWSDSVHQWRGIDPGAIDPDRSNVPGSLASIVRNWFAQSAEVVTAFPATILSVEPLAEHRWVIRTAFSSVDPNSHAVIPLGIMRTVVEIDDGNAVFKNPLAETTAQWQHIQQGTLTYILPPGSNPDRRRMREAEAFVFQISNEFGVDAPSHINYVVARNRDELCSVVGLEYFALPPQGLAWPASSTIVVGNGDVAYAHELVHVVLSSIDVSHPVIREGIATLYGGSLGRPFVDLLREYRATRSDASIPSFTMLFTNDNLSQDDLYILGAAVCEQIRASHGVGALRLLLATESRSECMRLVAQYLDVEPGDTMAALTEVVEASMISMQSATVTGNQHLQK